MHPLDPVRDRLQAAVTNAQARTGVPSISAGIVLGDELVWSGSIGHADQATGRLADSNTPYRIASITKPFTATAILQLRDEGRLALHDPLVAHVPEFAAAANRFGPIEQVTLRALLTHTSGLQTDPPLADPFPLVWGYRTRTEILATCDRMAVVIEPGTRFKYSNLGFELLGEVVRRRGGKPFGEYVAEHITGPLGMTNTVHDPDPELAAHCAVGYERRFEDAPKASPPLPDAWCRACGGLWSTVNDLSRWIRQQFRTRAGERRGPGQVLDGTTLAEMHRPIFVLRPPLEGGQGIAWGMWRVGDLVMTGHNGGLDGFNAQMTFNRAARLGIIVLSNGTPEVPKLAGELTQIAAPIATALATADPSVDVPVRTPEAWRPFLGAYQQGGSHVQVETRGETLTLVHTGLPSSLIPLGPTDESDTFTITDGTFVGEMLRFVRDSSGRVVRLVEGSEPYLRLEATQQ